MKKAAGEAAERRPLVLTLPEEVRTMLDELAARYGGRQARTVLVSGWIREAHAKSFGAPPPPREGS